MEHFSLLASAIIQPAQTQEEIMIMSEVSKMVKHFLRENVIIWSDPNVYSHENYKNIAELKKTYDVQPFADWKAASSYLKKETQISRCQVITSGTNGEVFVKEISNLPSISSIYIFDSDTNCHKTWDKQYKSKVTCAVNKFESLLKKIKSSLRVDLPSFAPIFDDIFSDWSKMNYLHIYLQGLINFTNRSQAKTDFLDLARELYGKNKDIQEFEKNYNKYDMKAILNWYTKDSFLHTLTNNCLRLANSDSILYSRLVLKDLETAIKEKYWKQSQNFCGLLYRGAYLSDGEWTKIQQNIDRDIEMHGFLSTTKQKDIAIAYCQEDMDKKVMITIIVPNFLDKGEQGFAEMSEYTDFPGEEEVLFNVRSRFRVLEATMEDIDGMEIRHLVLLYGAQAMKRFYSLHEPFFDVKITVTESIKCQVCKKSINTIDEPVIAINIYRDDEYLCNKCLQQPHITRKLVLICFSPSSHRLMSFFSEKRKSVNLQINGVVMQYQDGVDLPFYGYKCKICNQKKPVSCYTCLECTDERIIYCNNCFHDQSKNSCSQKGHFMLLERCPYIFWNERMSKTEEIHLNYQKEYLKEAHLFKQDEIFYKTHNYEKAIECTKKYLEKNGESKNSQTADNYSNLGKAYHSLGDYYQAIGYFSKSLEIRKAVSGDNHPSTAISYNNLGGVFNDLGEYHKALEYYSKSVQIDEVVFGNNHPTTAASYNNLGKLYDSLGEYQKSIEYFSKSLEINKAAFGDNYLETAISYNNLALACLHSEEYEKAANYLPKSLEVMRGVFGDNHPSTATFYDNIGEAFAKFANIEKATELYSKALELRKVVFGDNHPSIAISYNHLGEVCVYSFEQEKAIEYCSKSLEITKAVFGDHHPLIANAYNTLGHAYRHLAEFEKAIECFSQSVEVNKVIFGDNHPSTANSYKNLESMKQDFQQFLNDAQLILQKYE